MILGAVLLVLYGHTAIAEDVFRDRNAADQIRRSVVHSGNIREAFSLNLNGMSLSALSLADNSFVLFRPVEDDRADAGSSPTCFDGVKMSLRRSDEIVVGNPFGGMRFCLPAGPNRYSYNGVNATLYIPRSRIVVLGHGSRKKAQLNQPTTRIFVYDAATGKQVQDYNVDGELTQAVPISGDKLISVDRSARELFAVPDGSIPELEQLNNLENWGDPSCRSGPALKFFPDVLLTGDQRLGILDALTGQIFSFDRPITHDSYGTVRYLLAADSMVKMPGGFAWTWETPERKRSVFFFELKPGQQPKRIVEFNKDQYETIFAQGDSVVLRSRLRAPWSRVLNVLLMDDAKASAYLMTPTTDTGGDPYFEGESDFLPAEVSEARIDWPAGAHVTENCYELPDANSWGKVRNSDAPIPKAAVTCPFLWRKALGRMRSRKQISLPKLGDRKDAAAYCLNALLRERASELMNCIEADSLAKGGDTNNSLAAALATIMQAKAEEYDSDAMKIFVQNAVIETLAPKTKELRYDLLSYDAQFEGMPHVTLSDVKPTSFVAQWKFDKGEKPFTIQIRFQRRTEHKGKHGASTVKRLPWVVTETTYIDAAGKAYPGLRAGALSTSGFRQ